MDKTPQQGLANLRLAFSAGTRWSSAARGAVGAAAVALCLFGATACRHSDASPSDPSGISSPTVGQVQQQGGSDGPSLPPLGTPFTPSGHEPTSLPPLPGSGS
jgi:hypothetical protein